MRVSEPFMFVNCQKMRRQSLTSRTISHMRFSFIATLISSGATLLGAQQPAPRVASDQNRDAPRASATRLTGTIHIDGSLNEPQWKTATPIGDLTQLAPPNPTPAPYPSHIR